MPNLSANARRALPASIQTLNPFTSDRIASATALTSLMAMTVLVTLPALLPLARRLTPWLLAYCALLTLLAFARSRSAIRAIGVPVVRALVALVALMGWATVSLQWSLWSDKGLESVGLGVAMLTTAAIVTAAKVNEHTVRLQRWLAFGLTIGASLVVLDLLTGAWIISTFHRAIQTYNYNMVVVTLLALSFAQWRKDPAGSWWPNALSIVAVVIAIFISDSQSAQLAIAVAALAAIAAACLPLQIFRPLMIAALGFYWLASPWLTTIADYVALDLGYAGNTANIHERLEIWRGYSLMSLQGLPLGWGVGSSGAASLIDTYPTLADDIRKGLRASHPHSNPLQVLIELGLPGVLFAWVASAQMLYAFDISERQERARVAAALAGLLTVGLVGHGLWQGWWLATIVCALFAMRITSAAHDTP
jgi:exopolysaccharide production protein ExoQ